MSYNGRNRYLLPRRIAYDDFIFNLVCIQSVLMEEKVVQVLHPNKSF